MDIARINDEKPDISDLINIINRRLAANGRAALELVCHLEPKPASD